MKGEQVTDIKKVMEMCKNNQLSRHEQSDRPKVGDLILYNGSKTYGHVIQVMDEGLKVVDD